MSKEYIKHEYPKGVWYEEVRKVRRTARQRQADLAYQEMSLSIQRMMQPQPNFNPYTNRSLPSLWERVDDIFK